MTQFLFNLNKNRIPRCVFIDPTSPIPLFPTMDKPRFVSWLPYITLTGLSVPQNEPTNSHPFERLFSGWRPAASFQVRPVILFVVLPPNFRFTLEEWHLNTQLRYRNCYDQQTLADRVLAESDRVSSRFVPTNLSLFCSFGTKSLKSLA